MSDPLGGVISVRCQQVGHTLLKDFISSYSRDVGDGDCPSDILADFLAYQEYERVTFGGVDVALEFPMAIDITWSNIWEACKVVRDTVGGYLTIELDLDDPSVRKLWLKENIGEITGQQIRLGKNLTGMSYRKDSIDYANRLYPVGDSNLLLSTIDYSEVPAAASSDASYGYLTLIEKHGAYKDWTGEGDALPGHITVGKPTGAWANPTGHSASESVGWGDPASAYDDNEATNAYWLRWWRSTWTNYLTLSIGATLTHQIKFPNAYTTGSDPSIIYWARIQADIYYGAAWHNIYDAITPSPEDFITAVFADQTITGVRIRYYNTADASHTYIQCNVCEVYVWDGNAFADDSANWEQGADEQTLRCAIGDYTADIGYVLDYTHAAYLIDLTDVTGRDDIYSNQEPFSTDDIESLIAQARVRLDEILEPVISMEIDMLNLGAEDGREYEKLELGNRVTMIDEGLEVEITTNVVRINTPDLNQPGKIEVELSNKTKDIIDVI